MSASLDVEAAAVAARRCGCRNVAAVCWAGSCRASGEETTAEAGHTHGITHPPVSRSGVGPFSALRRSWPIVEPSPCLVGVSEMRGARRGQLRARQRQTLNKLLRLVRMEFLVVGLCTARGNPQHLDERSGPVTHKRAGPILNCSWQGEKWYGRSCAEATGRPCQVAKLAKLATGLTVPVPSMKPKPRLRLYVWQASVYTIPSPLQAYTS